MKNKIVKTFEEHIENLNISGVSDSDFILKKIEEMLNKQEEDIINYMNTVMTQTERNRHGDNIWGYLLRAQGTLAEIRLEMMADGREIK